MIAVGIRLATLAAFLFSFYAVAPTYPPTAARIPAARVGPRATAVVGALSEWAAECLSSFADECVGGVRLRCGGQEDGECGAAAASAFDDEASGVCGDDFLY